MVDKDASPSGFVSRPHRGELEKCELQSSSTWTAVARLDSRFSFCVAVKGVNCDASEADLL